MVLDHEMLATLKKRENYTLIDSVSKANITFDVNKCIKNSYK